MIGNRKIYNNHIEIILALILLVLIGFNVFLINRLKYFKEVNKNNHIITEQKIFDLESLNIEFKVMIFNSLHSESTILDPNLLLLNIGSDSITNIDELAINGPLLVLRFTEHSCHVCVERILQKVRNNTYIMNPERFVIFTSYENLRDLLLFKRNNHVDYPVYTIYNDSLSIPLEVLNIPYFFVLDNNLSATNIFYPLTSSPGLTDNYFEILKNKYPILWE